MLTYSQSLIMGLIQGVTELFPISSLGHSVILPSVFDWNVHQSDDSFVIFLVATHLATALVLFFFYYKDWVLIIKGIFRSLKERNISDSDVYAKLGWLIIVASIPAGILGLLFEDKLKALFASPHYASLFLIANGLVLLGLEFFFSKKRGQKQRTESETEKSQGTEANLDATVSKLTWGQSIVVGCTQCLALLPGFSRTGMTMGGGLAMRLNHESALRFSFILATPIILAAAVLKLPELASSANASSVGPIVVGSLAAAIAAYCAIRFLSKYFKTKTLKPFGVYCMLAGVVALLIVG